MQDQNNDNKLTMTGIIFSIHKLNYGNFSIESTEWNIQNSTLNIEPPD